MCNDCLWKFNTKNSVCSQFIVNGSIETTRGKFSGGCFTGVAAFFNLSENPDLG